MDGLILFAHGSREPEWARPLERLRDQLQSRLRGERVLLAFLESMAPTLPEALDLLASQGVLHVRLLPLFLGQGRHVRDDVDRVVERARASHPGLAIQVLPALGDQPAVMEALAAAIAQGLAGGRSIL